MYIKVKVISESRRESVKKDKKDKYVVSVREPARGNLANKRMLQLLARRLEIPVEKIRIINGHHSPSKLVSIRE